MAAVPVLVFSDFTCPFSYVTEAALWRLEDEGAAAPAYSAFELYPAPAPLGGVDGGWMDAAAPLARAAGVEMRLPPLAARTRKAHEAAKLAERKGMGREMRRAIYTAYFAEGADVGRIDVLVALAVKLGLDEGEARVMLDVDTFAEAVQRDRALAARIGITGTPALVVGADARAELLLGAQDEMALRRALERAGD